MKLSKRLSMIANLVRPCQTLADVGSDHAYIPCALVLNNQCAFAFAGDIAAGPLQQAKANIDKYGLQGKVVPVLSNGLAEIEPVDTIIIAGMGVVTAIEIMEAGLDKIKKAKQVIVQVNKDPMTLRDWISNHHFTIDNEACVFEDHDYVAISFSSAYHDTYTPQQCYLGPILMHHLNEDTTMYYNHLKENNKYLLDKVKDDQKLKLIQQHLEWLNTI